VNYSSALLVFPTIEALPMMKSVYLLPFAFNRNGQAIDHSICYTDKKKPFFIGL